MNTEQLIEKLSREITFVSQYAVPKRIGIGLAAGGLITIVAVISVLGIRPDLRAAMHGFSFWMKWTYTISLTACAAYWVTRLARPDPGPLRALWLVALPVLLLVGISISELARTPSSDWLAMWLGKSWKACPFLVLTFAVPIFLGLLWSFRKLAPTHLRTAGAVAGLAAGAFAATIYCLHCPEASALFVLSWYSLGIALSAAIGALLGPRLMRW